MTDFLDHTLGFADVMSAVFIASATESKNVKLVLGLTWFILALVQ